MLTKTLRDKIVAQAVTEIAFDRRYKQGKIKNWQKNEDLYYAKKVVTPESTINVDLGRMQEFVHTLLSKIDNPLVFKYTKRKESQLRRVQRLNALRVVDQQYDDWDIKDLVGKKQAVLYGRAIYSYYADSFDGYKPHLENVDVYDFLIDPAAGGIDIERARHLGRYGVVKDKAELKQGVKDGIYLKPETNRLIEGDGNATETNQEETNKRNRTADQNTTATQKEGTTLDKYKFWEWYTTFEGERYYLLIQESSGCAIRIEKLTDIFASNMWPFWSWAAFPDLTEFWTPSYSDYVREIFMAQATSINQMIENGERVNKPQKVVNVTMIDNLAELKYRRDGYIKVKGSIDANKAIQILQTPSINTPIEVFNVLENIHEKASGVTAASKGDAEEDKVGIYEGNQANTSDRFGLLNKSYSFGYKRFAKLYEHGVREHLSKKVSVDILGPSGIEVEMVSRRDIFRKDDQFGVLIEASNAELQLSEVDKRTKLVFLGNNAMNPVQNPKKSYEISATIAGFNEDQIKELMDTSEFGDAQLLSEAERDIEAILDGKEVKPNRKANTAYKQKFVDYMADHGDEEIDNDQFARMAAYVESLEPIIMQNMVRQANVVAQKQIMATPEVEQPADDLSTGFEKVTNNQETF